MNGRHGAHGLGEDSRFDEAWGFVIEHQGDQNRKGTDIAYTTHLRGVAQRVLDDGGTSEEAIGGMLHDVVEDTPVNKGGHSVEVDEVRAKFGDRVAEVVDFCTDTEPKPGEPKEPWRERKEEHFEKLRSADAGTLRVVAADKTDNLTGQLADFEECGEDAGDLAKSLTRFKGGLAGTLWYYRGMRAAMGNKLEGSRLHGELSDKITRLARLRSPSADELDCRDRLRLVLDAHDPRAVGALRVADGHYAIDAEELARRATVPEAAETADIVELLVTQWYGETGWSDATKQAAADALAGASKLR